MGLNDLSVVFLLLLSRSLHLAADTPASAKVGDINSTSIEFLWTESPSQRLQHILLRATSDTGSTVEVKIAPNIGQGHLENLEPYTYYSTSVTYVTADDSAENEVHDTGTVRTWPKATEQLTFKCAIALGERMMLLEWTKPKKIEGFLGHYTVNVAPYDDPDSAKDIRTRTDSLKLLITHLQANTKYKFTIRAYVLPDEQGNGGGYSIPSVAGYVTTSVSEASSADKYNWETGAAESGPAVGL